MLKLRVHVDERGHVDMLKNFPELKDRLIKGYKRDGRSIYDEAAKQELIQVCQKSGVSVARAAMQCGTTPICWERGLSSIRSMR